MATTVHDLCEYIRKKIQEVYTLDCFTDWINKEKHMPGDLILINNSFFYRERTATTKSPLYLALLANHEEIEKADVVVATSEGINADFRRFRKNRDWPEVISLEQACHQELSSLRRLVHILIGELDFTQEFSQTIQHSLFDCLVLRPNMNVNLAIEGKSIIVKRVDDEEWLWNELNNETKLPDGFLQPFLKAVEDIRKKSYVKLVLPQAHSFSDQTFLDLVVSAFKRNAHEYRESLEKWNSGTDEPQEYTNILRIAYNFAKEGITLLQLLFKLCDLKPILLWMTIKEHIELNEAFRNLPKIHTRTKFSLSEYEHMIGNARNRAFHHLLPFEHTLFVQLDGVPLAAKHLLLFPEFSSSRNKKRIALEYEDRELVEILTEFTRSRQRYVSPSFWLRNLDVMSATIKLLVATSKALKILNDVESIHA